MKIQLFTIPIYDNDLLLESFNKFLVSHRVTDIQKSFAPTDNGGYWTFCVTYIETPVNTSSGGGRKAKTDYRQELEEKDFALFCEFRKVRKQIAESEAIPPFAVFTDAELAEIVKLKEINLATMKTIPGVGDRKVEKYGTILIEALHEKSGESDGSDN